MPEEEHDHDHDHEGHDHDHEGHDHEHEHVVTEAEASVDDAIGSEAEPSEGGGETESIVTAEPEAGLVEEEEPSVSDETSDSPAEDRGEAE